MGSGIRNYLMLEYQLKKNLSIWFRYAQTKYTDREEGGSGVDQIKGNKKSDIKIQMRLLF
jgi:hypothetical protein